MAEVWLDCPGILAIVGKLISTGMAHGAGPFQQACNQGQAGAVNCQLYFFANGAEAAR